MPNEHTITTVYKSEGGSVNIKKEVIQPEISVNIESASIPAGATDTLVTISLPTADLMGWGMGVKKSAGEPSGNVELLVETNSSTSPTNTFTLTATNGVGWSTNDPTTNPITADVTALYLTNNGDVACDFFLRAGLDVSAT